MAVSGAIGILGVIFIFVFLAIPLIVLQVVICTKKRNPYGIIIPIGIFAVTLVFCIVLLLFMIDTGNTFMMILLLFAMMNIPTAICLIIYLVTGRTNGQNKKNINEMEHMKIQDL